MKELLLLSLFAFASSSFAQGVLDVDNDIRMEVAGEEHVKITSTDISFHDNTQTTSTPLLYGDFDNGQVGVGTDNPNHELDVNGTVNATEIISGNQTVNGTQTINGSQTINGAINANGITAGTSTINGKLDVNGALEGNSVKYGSQKMTSVQVAMGGASPGYKDVYLGKKTKHLNARITLFGTQTNSWNQTFIWEGVVIWDKQYNQLITHPFHTSKLSAQARLSGNDIYLRVTDQSNGDWAWLKGSITVWN